MRAMTADEIQEHMAHVDKVTAAIVLLGQLPDDVRATEDLAVAVARLTGWLDDNRNRWVT